MPMLYLNVRHTLPMIGMRVQRNTLDSSINQPRYEQETQTARSTYGKARTVLRSRDASLRKRTIISCKAACFFSKAANTMHKEPPA